VYSFLYFARALGANLGIVASSFILPEFGWFGCFIFYGILTVISFVLLMVFNEKPIPSSTKERPITGLTPPWSSGKHRAVVP
jgi:MFS family permease